MALSDIIKKIFLHFKLLFKGEKALKLKDLKGFNSLNSFVFDKIKRLNSYEKTFEVLFDFMFEQEDNVFAETSRGFRISTLTYGEVKKQTINFAKKLKKQL